MQIVIDISDEIYEIAKKGKWKWPANDVYDAIQSGIPLPEGHGRLIDVSEYFKKEFGDARMFLDKATTIIEADKESEG